MTHSRGFLVGLLYVPLLVLGACSSDESSEETTNPDQEVVQSLWTSMARDLQAELCKEVSTTGITEAGKNFQAYAVGQGQPEVKKENAETFLQEVCDGRGGIATELPAPFTP